MHEAPAKKKAQRPTLPTQRRRTRRGTTLVEILACLTFLSLTVYPMLSCITYSVRASLRSQEQMVVMALVQDAMDAQRAKALTQALTPGSTPVSSTPTFGNSSVTITTTVALMSGYADLYQVTVTGTWTDATNNFQSAKITSVSYMRAPHV